MIEFNGETYNDDRMFVLYICKCTVSEDGEMICTKIYHKTAPDDHKWCLVTYRNIPRYQATRTDTFDSKDEAKAYMEKIEPMVPLISLGGRQPIHPLSYSDFVEWKTRNKLKEYDYKQMYIDGGTNPVEFMYTKIS